VADALAKQAATSIFVGPEPAIVINTTTVGSLSSDHYFRSVCLFVCLFVQRFSQPSLIRFRSNYDITACTVVQAVV